MSTTYAHRQTTAQMVADSKAASLFDSSSQSESLQRKANMANNATQRAEAPRPNNTGMPDNLKSGIESLSGFSMDNVRVHYNSSKPATVQALAYTQGTDIHVAPGQEKHLPHEAWHVAQQMAGRVSPTTNINGMPVNDNAALEHEADVMGEKAVQCKIKENKKESTNPNNIAQMKKVSADHIAEDLIHEQNKNLFNIETIDWFNAEMPNLIGNTARKPDGAKAREFAERYSQKIKYNQRSKNKNKRPDSLAADIQKTNQYDTLFTEETIDLLRNNPSLYEFNKKLLIRCVEDNRDCISYKQLRTDILKNTKAIRKWFGSKSNEYMYVHVDDNIHIANRDTEKLPHPTLVGGDPDAKCAGTMEWNNSKKIITITNESGHFRPPEVDPNTIDKVREITKNLKIKVTSRTV